VLNFFDLILSIDFLTVLTSSNFNYVVSIVGNILEEFIINRYIAYIVFLQGGIMLVIFLKSQYPLSSSRIVKKGI